MVTDREHEILSHIAENPLISQQEIAERCGITRSSVAVHISNLIKKGVILRGKGYVLNTDPYIAVVGAANLDICGTPNESMVSGDKNPGKIRLAPGGVGRNIAHNLALLGQNVHFITVFGDDAFSEILINSCKQASMNLNEALVLPGGKTAVYMCVTNKEGDMESGISDMDIYNSISKAFLSMRLETINNARVCVTDTNLPADSLAYLMKSCKPPLFVDPVSLAKVGKIKGLLSYIHTLKLNRLEAEFLSEITIADENSLRKAAERLLGEGLKQVFITLGKDGVYCADAENQYRLPAAKADVCNTTGAGDAFTAAIVWAYLNEYSIEKAAKVGVTAAALNTVSSTAVNEEMNANMLTDVI